MVQVPEGWLDYCAFGQPISDTRIIAIKTPLKHRYNSGLKKVDSPKYVRGMKYKGGVPLEEEFTPSQLLDRLDRNLGKKLGAVIDLTNTNRYYDSKELTDNGVKYAKIKCPGRQVPSEEVCIEFDRVLSRFLSEIGQDSLVGVHCTHGLNRTGYLICRYLVEKKIFDVDTAIKNFNEARGHHIERENYLEHLKDGCPVLAPSSLQETDSSAHVHHYEHRAMNQAGRSCSSSYQRREQYQGSSSDLCYQPPYYVDDMLYSRSRRDHEPCHSPHTQTSYSSHRPYNQASYSSHRPYNQASYSSHRPAPYSAHRPYNQASHGSCRYPIPYRANDHASYRSYYPPTHYEYSYPNCRPGSFTNPYQ